MHLNDEKYRFMQTINTQFSLFDYIKRDSFSTSYWWIISIAFIQNF